MWLRFTLGIWNRLMCQVRHVSFISPFGWYSNYRYPAWHHNRIGLQSSKREPVKMMLFFNTCSIRIYISRVSILKLHASQSSGISWKLKLPRVFCRWEGNMINMSNQVFITSRTLHVHRLMYTGHIVHLSLNYSKSKQFWKAALLHTCVCLTKCNWFDRFWIA